MIRRKVVLMSGWIVFCVIWFEISLWVWFLFVSEYSLKKKRDCLFFSYVWIERKKSCVWTFVPTGSDSLRMTWNLVGSQFRHIFPKIFPSLLVIFEKKKGYCGPKLCWNVVMGSCVSYFPIDWFEKKCFLVGIFSRKISEFGVLKVKIVRVDTRVSRKS